MKGWDITYITRVYRYYYYYFHPWHSLLQCSFMQPLWKTCCSSALLWNVQIAAPTALSAGTRLCSSPTRLSGCKFSGADFLRGRIGRSASRLASSVWGRFTHNALHLRRPICCREEGEDKLTEYHGNNSQL